MVISRRRLWWGCVLTLAFISCCLLAPVRSRLQQAFVCRMLNAQVEVDQVRFHRDASVIEARGVRWSIVNRDRECQLSASRLWLAVEIPSLLERRFLSPSGVLEDARLVFSCPSSAAEQHSEWQQELARSLQQFEWLQIKANFQSLQSAEKLAQDWESRIARWLERSREILASTQTLADEANGITNALRFEHEIQNRIARIEALRTEQGLLVNQFGGIRQLLEAETMRLQQMRTNELLWLEGYWGDLDAADHAGLARTMLVELGKRAWHDYAPFVEVADRLSSASPLAERQRAGFDRDVRPVDMARPIVALRGLTAKGVFAFQGHEHPFVFKGEVESGRAERQVRPYYSTALQFGRPEGQIVVTTMREEGGQSNAVRLTRHHEAKTGLPAAQDGSLAIIDIDSAERGLVGLLQVQPETLDRSELADFIRSAAHGIVDRTFPVQLAVSGAWDQPRLELADAAPQWLIAAVADELASRIAQAKSQVHARYIDDFQSSFDRLQTVATESAVKGQQVAEAHRGQLIATRDRLQAEVKQRSAAALGTRTTDSMER